VLQNLYREIFKKLSLGRPRRNSEVGIKITLKKLHCAGGRRMEFVNLVGKLLGKSNRWD
jgi:hypothetical protein